MAKKVNTTADNAVANKKSLKAKAKVTDNRNEEVVMTAEVEDANVADVDDVIESNTPEQPQIETVTLDADVPCEEPTVVNVELKVLDEENEDTFDADVECFDSQKAVLDLLRSMENPDDAFIQEICNILGITRLKKAKVTEKPKSKTPMRRKKRGVSFGGNLWKW